MASTLPTRAHSILILITNYTYGAGMHKLTRALFSVLKSLAHSTSVLHRVITAWYLSILRDSLGGGKDHSNGRVAPPSSPPEKQLDLDVYAAEVEALLGEIYQPGRLPKLSQDLQKQYRHALEHDPSCMLPSYNHILPTGHERGTFLALDVGGSTFRVAVVELSSQSPGDGMTITALNAYKITDAIKQLDGAKFFDWMAARIQDTLVEYGHGHGHEHNDTPLSMGLAWSFPIEYGPHPLSGTRSSKNPLTHNSQTSLSSGRLLPMGKGFHACDPPYLGADVASLLHQSLCRLPPAAPATARAEAGSPSLPSPGSLGNLKLHAIVNDTAATLFAKAFSDRETRFGLIVGTGVNMAVHLPVSAVGSQKYGERGGDLGWWQRQQAQQPERGCVVVNTELSMFGKAEGGAEGGEAEAGGVAEASREGSARKESGRSGRSGRKRDVLPLTRWDKELDGAHLRPGFQPLEHLVSGRYLGEIVRLILVEGVVHHGVCSGVVPPSLKGAYSLDTGLLAHLESCEEGGGSEGEAKRVLDMEHPLHPVDGGWSDGDVQFLRETARRVARRGAAVLASAVHALWMVRNEAEAEAEAEAEGCREVKEGLEVKVLEVTEGAPGSATPMKHPHPHHTVMACSGSVIQNYPRFREACQGFLDELVGEEGVIELKCVVESSLLGAAVAVAVAVDTC
jgi:hexokinase